MLQVGTRQLNAQFLADEMYRHPSVKSLRYMMMLYDEARQGSSLASLTERTSVVS